jgi:hypothetical protein
MKYIIALSSLLLAIVAAPTFAHEMTNECATKAAKITDTAEHSKFMESCLKHEAEEKSAKEEQHDKEQHCDTNAMNMKLEGEKKAAYLKHCYKENDFDKSNPHPKM